MFAGEPRRHRMRSRPPRLGVALKTMESHEHPEVRPEHPGEMPQREEPPADAPPFDERQQTPEAERAGEASESPAEQTPKP